MCFMNPNTPGAGGEGVRGGGETGSIGKGFLDTLGNTEYYIPLLRFPFISILKTEKSYCKRTCLTLLNFVLAKLT